MNLVTSLPASAVSSEELDEILADYLALERVRIFRRLLVTRFGFLALATAVAGLGLHWLPVFASWFSVGVFLVPPVWAWVVECQRSRRLARRLEEVPNAVTRELLADSDLRKS